MAKSFKESFGKAVDSAKDTIHNAAEKKAEATEKIKEKIVGALDQNGNNEIDVQDIISLSVKVPGVYVNREKFLRAELSNLYLVSTVDETIRTNPMRAGVKKEDIDSIADDVIKRERVIVSGISSALGLPGGYAMAATIPTDLAQYYGALLKVAQKLLYLYGFPEIVASQDGDDIDSATMNTLIICLGIMYGVSGANTALKAMATALGKGVEKKLLNTALTKGTIYPMVKSIAKIFNVKITKDIFAGAIGKAIPLVGGALGGGITFFSFKPCCDRLKAELCDTMLSNPNNQPHGEEDGIVSSIENNEIVDVDAIEEIDV